MQIDLNVYLNICYYMYLFAIVMKYVMKDKNWGK